LVYRRRTPGGSLHRDAGKRRAPALRRGRLRSSRPRVPNEDDRGRGQRGRGAGRLLRSEEHTSELPSLTSLLSRALLGNKHTTSLCPLSRSSSSVLSYTPSLHAALPICSFIAVGRPAVRFIETQENVEHQHSVEDVFAHLAPGYLTRMTAVVASAAALLSAC